MMGNSQYSHHFLVVEQFFQLLKAWVPFHAPSCQKVPHGCCTNGVAQLVGPNWWTSGDTFAAPYSLWWLGFAMLKHMPMMHLLGHTWDQFFATLGGFFRWLSAGAFLGWRGLCHVSSCSYLCWIILGSMLSLCYSYVLAFLLVFCNWTTLSRQNCWHAHDRAMGLSKKKDEMNFGILQSQNINN